MKRILVHAASALILLTAALPASAVNADYAEGQKLFAGKNYRAAATKFESAMKATPRDANTIYYCALANQMCSNRTRARQLYEYLTSSFTTSPVAGMARTALGQLGGAAPTAGATGGGVTSSGVSSTSSSVMPASGSDFKALAGMASPDEFRIPFERGRNGSGVYIDVQVNSKPMKFHLDTGAGMSLMGANQLQDLGFQAGTAGHKFGIHGVGGGSASGWQQPVQLVVGQARVRDFPITVQDSYEGEPLLGQDFLRNFETDIDPASSQVTFRKRGVKAATRTSRGQVDVPFEDGPGGHIIVTPQVNGKPYKFYFDTGADGIALGQKDLKPLGLSIPDDARESQSIGVLGASRTWEFTVDRVKLGSIVKDNVKVHVVESSSMDHPLLGQSFFGDWRHKVDIPAHVIHFWPGD